MPHAAADELLPDVLLVPMLAFDRAGFRLGYGGGFYDRTVAWLRQVKPIVADRHRLCGAGGCRGAARAL